jgi:cytochrome P450
MKSASLDTLGIVYKPATTFHTSLTFDASNPVPRSNFGTVKQGPKACLGQNLAQDELRIIMLMTVKEYEFGCKGLKPNANPRTS